MSTRSVVLELLLRGGRLLLEYNESTEAIHRTLAAVAQALTDQPCHIAVSYNGVAVSLAGGGPAMEPIHELRYNMAVLANVHAILARVRLGEIEPAVALDLLGSVEGDTKRHPRWLAVLVLGVAAASLARLLGADAGACGVAGLGTGLGLFVRQELGRRHFSLLTLPLTAAFLGAVLGGLAIRLEWTRTPELVLIVPALMLVPGPHLLNGLLDLIDDHLPMSLARLGLAVGILLASALGVVLGVELTLADPVPASSLARAAPLTLPLDAVLAGVVACGFAVFYNTASGRLWMAIAGGMAGHGLRFLALEAGSRPEAAAFLGGLGVGAVASWLARNSRTPVVGIAFAGAVTMMPGLAMYRALGAALKLGRQAEAADPTAVALALGNAIQAGLVVGGLALGLVLGIRGMQALVGHTTRPGGPGKSSPG